MPSDHDSTGGARFIVRSLDWSEDECRQWVQALAKLCIDTYTEKQDLRDAS
jgi:hypothetical protein